jgi:tyrosine-protein phosphatase SIW14
MPLRNTGWLLLPFMLFGPLPAAAELPNPPAREPAGLAAEAQTDAWVKMVREKADNGGWLVVRGTGAGDQLVTVAARATLSHAVVLDKQKEEVIEAVPSGVRVTPLRALLAQAQRLQIIRPPGWTPAAGQAAVARARSHIGQKYDWLGPVAAQDDKRFYCTALAVDSYRGREAGWKMGTLIFPADMATIGTVIFDSGARDPASAPEPRFARRLADARGVAYAAEVAPGLYRGGQPSAEGVAWLKSKGFKAVLNLRHYHGDSEKQLVESVGMHYEHIALTSWGAPSPEQIARFLQIVRDPTMRPLYVHCQHGVDRTGAMMAVYRMEEEGWSNPQAFAEMEYFDAHSIWRDLREFVRKYHFQPQPARLEAPR